MRPARRQKKRRNDPEFRIYAADQFHSGFLLRLHVIGSDNVFVCYQGRIELGEGCFQVLFCRRGARGYDCHRNGSVRIERRDIIFIRLIHCFGLSRRSDRKFIKQNPRFRNLHFAALDGVFLR